MIRTYIADDSESVRRDLHTLLELNPSTEIIGEAGSIDSMMADIFEKTPDILILDLEFRGGKNPNELSANDFPESCAAIRQIKKNHKEIKVFVLTMHGFDEAKRAALAAGADRFFVKGQDDGELFNALLQEGEKDKRNSLNQTK